MAEYLLDKGYEVHGLNRRKSVSNNNNIAHILNRIKLIEGDVTDTPSVYDVIDKGKYDELYNLAAQSHVGTSFKEPQTTFEINTLGVLNILEGLRRYSSHTRMYQASTSEMFGLSEPPQNEGTHFVPASPYGVSKLASHHLVNIYHKSYGLRCACGIMFNTDGPRRGENFVTKKIANWVKGYKADTDAFKPEEILIKPLELGNLDAKRDWSHPLDSVEAIYRICNQDTFKVDHQNKWKTYTFGSAVAVSVRQFLELCLMFEFRFSSWAEFRNRFVFSGEKENEIVTDTVRNKVIVRISKEFYRPLEVGSLRCDPDEIKRELYWQPKYCLNDIVKDMLA